MFVATQAKTTALLAGLLSIAQNSNLWTGGSKSAQSQDARAHLYSKPSQSDRGIVFSEPLYRTGSRIVSKLCK